MKKNYWPLGILLIIVIGVVLLVLLVYISLLQPNLKDNSYLQDSSVVEKNTDLFLGETKKFVQSYETQVYFAGMSDLFFPPYSIKAQKIERKNHKELLLKVQAHNIVTLKFIPLVKNPPKILDYKVYAMRYYDKDYRDKVDHLPQNLIESSFDFYPQKAGRWKVVLKIKILHDGEEKEVYLQRDFLAK
ncbi:hypothetical protein [Helicobacter anatolicus]|uniref:hypothetical protein n=1 Tax=Helicobacter anatolicus TaxID=2905874 RepID=UPI001E2CDF64|nr:hypothetical protein [Helicobacter anatolicus]MCE3038810.1 hypothetical protein [Helicobacter anatolicus]